MEKQFFDYEYYLFDLWGVIHDGTTPYPFVKDVLVELKNQNKKIGFISNAPRRASVAKQTLINIGIDDKFIDTIITSGECFYQNAFQNIKNEERIFYIGPDKDLNIVNDYKGILERQDPSRCKFAINTGFGDSIKNDDNLHTMLTNCKKHNVKMLCINPDLVVVKQDGSRFECAGVIAKMYHDIGGRVEYYGKPYPLIYDQIFSSLNISQKDKNKVIAIGDSMATDITGANNYGIDSVFCQYGIHKAEIERLSLTNFLNSKSAKPSLTITCMKDLLGV